MIDYKNMVSTKNIIFVLTSFVLLSSCAHKQNEYSKGFSSKTLSSQKTSLIGTAKEFNIPIPLGFRCSDKQIINTQNQYLAHYEGTLPVEKVIHFYRQEMEQRGGIFSDFNDQEEGIFYSNNPHDEYAFAIKRHNNKTHITCFCQIKKEAKNSALNDINTKKDLYR